MISNLTYDMTKIYNGMHSRKNDIDSYLYCIQRKHGNVRITAPVEKHQTVPPTGTLK